MLNSSNCSRAFQSSDADPCTTLTAVLVQLERQNGHPGLEEAIPYVTQRLSTTARSMHHACVRQSGTRASRPSTKPSSRRAAKTAATGKTPRGRPPMPPVEGPLPTDQVNLTDEASRIMPVPGGGFEQCYNA